MRGYLPIASIFDVEGTLTECAPPAFLQGGFSGSALREAGCDTIFEQVRGIGALWPTSVALRPTIG
jgi:hypothetical protein